MFWAQSLLAGNGTGVTCLREIREPITTLNVITYVTPLMFRNFWLCNRPEKIRIVFTCTAISVSLKKHPLPGHDMINGPIGVHSRDFEKSTQQ